MSDRSTGPHACHAGILLTMQMLFQMRMFAFAASDAEAGASLRAFMLCFYGKESSAAAARSVC